jgi:AcrR family transcriptional regulator
MQTTGVRSRSTAEARRATVLRRAITVFARTGYHATPVAEVAEAADISTAYVFRLFDGKLGLFVAALEHCYERVEWALADGADRAGADAGPDQVLDAMGGAYAALIADRDLLMLQVHALSAAEVPEIGAAVRRGYERVVAFATERSGAAPAAVQRFIAYGQLCHLIVAAGLADGTGPWVDTLTAGIRHPGRAPAAPAAPTADDDGGRGAASA